MRQKQAGHDRPVFIYPILARNTVDDLVMERLSSKRSVQDVLLEAMKRRKR
jgi:SNF2 family DNA or RNA helicase